MKLRNQSCPICKEQKSIVQVEAEFYKCLFCEFYFKNRDKLLSREEEKQRYQLHENSMENEGYVKMFEHFIDEMQLGDLDARTTLDFGCGPGPVLAKLLKQNDISTDIYDPYFFPELPTKKFDLITSTEVFEHLKDPLDTFDVVDSLLNSNGHIAIMTQWHSNDDERFKKWYYKRDPTHISFFNRSTFQKICDYYDYEIIRDNGKNAILLQKTI